MMPETIIRINDDGTLEQRLLSQNDRDALFDLMFSLPKKLVSWEIEALADGSTRIKLSKAPRVKASVPTLEISGAWYDLVDAVGVYVKRFNSIVAAGTPEDQNLLPLDFEAVQP